MENVDPLIQGATFFQGSCEGTSMSISLSTVSRFKSSFAEETPPKLRASQLQGDQHVKEELVKEEPQWSQQDKQPGQKSKRKMPSMHASLGMDLTKKHPKNAVKEFLQRYFARDIAYDDYFYVMEEEEEGDKGEEGKCGFRAKLHVPIWSQQVFQGDWRNSPKEAEVSAAEQFVADLDVREAAANLPAPLKVIKYWNRLHDTRNTGAAVHERSRHEYNNQRNRGCRMALWDGKA